MSPLQPSGRSSKITRRKRGSVASLLTKLGLEEIPWIHFSIRIPILCTTAYVHEAYCGIDRLKTAPRIPRLWPCYLLKGVGQCLAGSFGPQGASIG